MFTFAENKSGLRLEKDVLSKTKFQQVRNTRGIVYQIRVMVSRKILQKLKK